MKLCILDNDTLDPSQAPIYGSYALMLERLMRGRATLMVAHRLSTVRSADMIHVLSAGRVLESGAHTQLIARDGAYAAMVRAQHGE